MTWVYGPDGMPKGWPQDLGIPTIGPDVLAWGETELVQPDGDDAGEPWQWRESQARFICWWYTVTSTGDWLFRRGQIVLPKGSGKSPLAAALSCCELAGPVRFGGWSRSGEPIAITHPSPWVQLAAVSQDQTDNTMSLVLAMLRDGPAARTIRGLDAGLSRVRTSKGILQPVTASAPSREGQRTTAAILDETHLWTAPNGGQRLASTIRRNLAKMRGRSLETTNTWIPGAGSVAEATADYADKIRAGELNDDALDDGGVLRWHPMASVSDLDDRPALRGALLELYCDAPWMDVDRIIAEIYDHGTDPQDAQRFYLNLITQATNSWLSEPEWRGCADPTVTVNDRDVIVLGFDGSRGRAKGKPDATALVGCRVVDGYVFEVGLWEADDNRNSWPDWTPPIPAIEAAIDMAFNRWTVAAFYADPGKDWRSHINAWEAKHGSKVQKPPTRDHPFEWWMTGGRAGLVERAIEQTEGAIRNRDLVHGGTYRLTEHALNARRRIAHGKLALGKENDYSPNKIDAAVAMVLAWQARLDALAAGVGQKRVSLIPTRIR